MKKYNTKKSIMLTTCITLFFIILVNLCYTYADCDLVSTEYSFYVSPTGNDSDSGSEGSPWRTIQKAADNVKPGDHVYIREGVYKERVSLSSSGSEGEYITFENYPGENVVIDGADKTWGYDWGCLFNLNGQKYIKVIGLKVINSVWAGIGYEADSEGCQNIIIQNCSTYNTKSSGIAFFSGSNIVIDNNSVELACTRTDGSQENISVCGVSDFDVKNNHVFNCYNNITGGGGEGISIKDGCFNGKIYNNTINNISKVAIYIDAYSEHQHDIEVYSNIIHDAGDGISLGSERGGSLENIYIHHNEVFDCTNWGYIISDWGKDVAHPMKNIIFSNNTAKNLGDGGVYLNNPDAENVVIKENVFITGSAYTPIYLNGGNLSETLIDGNILNRVVVGHPTGTNYRLYESMHPIQNIIEKFTK